MLVSAVWFGPAVACGMTARMTVRLPVVRFRRDAGRPGRPQRPDHRPGHAKSIEYPTDQLELAGAGWPWRPTALLALTATAAIGVALVPAAASRRNRR